MSDTDEDMQSRARVHPEVPPLPASGEDRRSNSYWEGEGVSEDSEASDESYTEDTDEHGNAVKTIKVKPTANSKNPQPAMNTPQQQVATMSPEGTTSAATSSTNLVSNTMSPPGVTVDCAPGAPRTLADEGEGGGGVPSTDPPGSAIDNNATLMSPAGTATTLEPAKDDTILVDVK